MMPKYNTVEEFFSDNTNAFDTNSKKGLFLTGRYADAVMKKVWGYYTRTGETNYFEIKLKNMLLNEKFDCNFFAHLMNECDEKLVMCDLGSDELSNMSSEVKWYITQSGFYLPGKEDLSHEEAKCYLMWGMDQEIGENKLMECKEEEQKI
jgi:hypothetical protein